MDDLHNTSEKNAESEGAVLREGGTVAPLEEKSHKKPNTRGGRGRKAGPELTRAVHGIQVSEERLKHDIARLEGDKERFIEQVADLEARLKVAQDEGLLKSTVKRLEALLTEAHDKLNLLKGVLPAQSTSRDRTLMEEVLKKWREYEHERTNQSRAENKINQNPEDKRAEGDFNRARAAAHSLKEEIHAIVKQGELIVGNDTPSPVHDEWVSYTREQAKTEEEALAKKHEQNIDSAPVPENKEVEEIVAEIVPETTAPAPIQHSTFDSVQDANLLIRQYSPPAHPSPNDIHPVTIDGDIHPIAVGEVVIEEPREANEDYLAKAAAGDAAWDLAQKQLEELNEKSFATQVEVQQAPLIVPEETTIETNTDVHASEETETTIDETNKIPSVDEETGTLEKIVTEQPEVAPTEQLETVAPEQQPEVATTEQPIPETSEEKIEPYIPTMPQEIVPTDQQVLVYADKQVQEHLDTLFGGKRFLGLWKTSGAESPDWNDPQVGFANKSVAEIMNSKPETSPSDGKKHFGIKDSAATDKMKEYLALAINETGVDSVPEERVGDYLKRASAITIGKFMKKRVVS